MAFVYFLSGIIFTTLISPVIEEFGDCLIAHMETWKAKSSEKINQINLNIQKAADETTPPKHIIGFAAEEDLAKETFEYDE